MRARQSAPDRPDARGVTLAPEGHAATLRLVEFVEAEWASDASPTAYVAVPFGKDVLIDVVNHDAPATNVPTPVRLLYGFGSDTASQVDLWLDSDPFASHTPLTEIARMLTPNVATGHHVLRIEDPARTPGGGRVAYIDQTPMLSTDTRMLRLRTVHLLELDRPMRVKVPKGSGESVTLNIVVTPIGSGQHAAENVTVRATVENAPAGQPATGYTPLTREYHVAAEPSDSAFLDAARYTPAVSRTCLLPLREDVPAGERLVRVDLRGDARGGGRAAVRFFILTEQAGSDRVRTWRVSPEQEGVR